MQITNTALEAHEQEIKSIDGRLFLTNYRVQFWSDKTYQSIRLADISFIGLVMRRDIKIIYGTLMLAFIVAFAYFGGGDNYEFSNLLTGRFLVVSILIVGIIIYFNHSRKFLKLGTSGGTIMLVTGISSDSEISEFVVAVEAAIFDATAVNMRQMATA